MYVIAEMSASLNKNAIVLSISMNRYDAEAPLRSNLLSLKKS